jgi:DNA invertase Pin-like site-specific DNA recombinase
LPTKGILVLAEWDRATRSLMDGIAIMEKLHKRDAYIKVLDRPGLDLTTPSGRGILALLSGLAEEERMRILKRVNEGRVTAIKRGTKLGRKSKLDDHQQAEAVKRLKASESLRTIAKSYRVYHATIGRLSAELEEMAAPGRLRAAGGPFEPHARARETGRPSSPICRAVRGASPIHEG